MENADADAQRAARSGSFNVMVMRQKMHERASEEKNPVTAEWVMSIVFYVLILLPRALSQIFADDRNTHAKEFHPPSPLHDAWRERR